MNRRKPLTILTAALLLCFTLAACGQGTSLSSSPASEPAPHMSGEETNSPSQSTTGAEDGTSATDDMADDDTSSAEETPSDAATTTAPSGDEADTDSAAATTSGTTSTTSRRNTTTRATTTRKTTTTTKPTTTTTRKTTTTTTTRKPTTTTTVAASGSGTVTAQMLATIEAEFLRLVNEERAAKGAAALTVNTHLDAAAAVRAPEIMTLFSHTRPDGSRCFTAIDKSKYAYRKVGENIGTSSFSSDGLIYSGDVFTGSDTQLRNVARNMFQSFKNSSGHYENMIDPAFQHTGVGVQWKVHETMGVPVFYFVHFFGTA